MSVPNEFMVITASNGENLRLAERFKKIGQELGATAEVLDLTSLDLPLFNPRVNCETGNPAIISELCHQMAAVPRWVICAPEYNGSIPPVFTNAVAWMTKENDDFRSLFNGRPIAMATFSGGGGMNLLTSMRIQLTHLGAQVVGRQLLSNKEKPAKDESIKELLLLLLQLNPLIS